MQTNSKTGAKLSIDTFKSDGLLALCSSQLSHLRWCIHCQSGEKSFLIVAVTNGHRDGGGGRLCRRRCRCKKVCYRPRGLMASCQPTSSSSTTLPISSFLLVDVTGRHVVPSFTEQRVGRNLFCGQYSVSHPGWPDCVLTKNMFYTYNENNLNPTVCFLL